MFWTILSVCIILFAPAGIIFLTKKVKFFAVIGAVALCYALGIILGVCGLPFDKELTMSVSEVTIPLAIPLILFSLNLNSAKRMAKKSLLSLVLVCVSVTVVVTAAFFISSPYIEDAAGITAMLSGLYTGGTPNLNAIGLALGVDSEILQMANTSDLIVGGFYFLFLLTFAKPVYSFILDRKNKNQESQCQNCESQELSQYAQEYTLTKLKGKKEFFRLVGVILLAVGCLGVSAGVAFLFTNYLNVTIVMLGVTAFGIGFSFLKPVRETKGTFQAGHYLILMFSLALSMSIDLSALVQSILPVLTIVACVQTATIALHVLLCRICKIDSKTALITSTAGVYGPAFIPPVAETLKDNSLLVPGLICGILGYAIGNFLGIGLGSLFLLF